MDKPTCAVGDCQNPARARGYCKRHYKNLRVYGDPIPRKDQPLDIRLREIGWIVTEAGCWEWGGKRNDQGYGIFNARRLGYENARAHRVMYGWLTEPVPDELELRHACDNPPCVNPEHLIPGTHADNMRDMADRGRCGNLRRDGRCANGHDVTLPGATKRIERSGKAEVICVECTRARGREYMRRQRERQRRPADEA